MKSKALTLVIISVIVALNSSVDAKAPARPAVKDVATLADKLIELESFELSTVIDLQDLAKQVETLAVPYVQGGNSMTNQQKTLMVLDEVQKYATDVKFQGSNIDMVEGGRLHALIYHYKTAINTRELRGQIEHHLITAVTRETEAWMKLENTLCEYYACLRYIYHQGGTMANLDASGCEWVLAEARYDDTQQWLQAGLDPNVKRAPMEEELIKKSNDIATSLIETANDLIDNAEDFKYSNYFPNVSTALKEACTKLNGDLQNWIKERRVLLALCKDQGMGLAQTFKLLDLIKERGDLEKEE